MTVVSPPENQQPLRVALLGAGIFASSAHAKTLKQYPEQFQCVAVWSRRLESAQKLVASAFCTSSGHNNNDVESGGFTCQAFGGEDDLENNLIQSSSSSSSSSSTQLKIDAFIVCLPIDVQPKIVERLLRAGKNVLSEKPIAPTVEVARPLVKLYEELLMQQQQQSSISTTIPSIVVPHWSVAENYRYEPAILEAAAAVEEHCGDSILLASLLIRGPFTTSNPFYQTTWRQQPSYQGGFFIDAFPHGVAALRHILGAEPTAVSAVTAKHSSHLPDIDTLTAHVQYQQQQQQQRNDGDNNPDASAADTAAQRPPIQGVIAITYACVDLLFELQVTGTQGSIKLERKGPGYELSIVSSASMDKKQNLPISKFIPFGGIEAEFLAFAEACRASNVSSRKNIDVNTPREALRDIEFVEACLMSGKSAGAMVTIEASTL